MRFVPALALVLFPAAGVALADTPPPAAPPSDADELYRMGRQLFEQYAPPEVKEQYEFPSKVSGDGRRVPVRDRVKVGHL